MTHLEAFVVSLVVRVPKHILIELAQTSKHSFPEALLGSLGLSGHREAFFVGNPEEYNNLKRFTCFCCFISRDKSGAELQTKRLNSHLLT